MKTQALTPALLSLPTSSIAKRTPARRSVPDRVRGLVVTSDPAVDELCTRALSEGGRDVRSCAGGEAWTLLAEWAPSVVVVDLDTCGATVSQLLGPGADKPMAAFVAIGGEGGATEAFRLAQAGVRAYVAKPVTRAALSDILEQVIARPPDITPLLRAAVGHFGIHDLERTTRRVMLEEAMARAAGSRRAAAKLLSVSRQLLQHMLRGQKRAC